MINIKLSEIPPHGKIKYLLTKKNIKLALMLFIFITSTSLAQTNYLVTEDSDGIKTYENVADIGKLTFGTTFTCGDRLVYGNETYPTVLIGNQCWFAKNLNIGKRIDVASNQTSTDTQIEKYCYEILNCDLYLYGGLYQWAEAVAYTNGATNTSSPSPAFSGNIQGICPTGWHIPTLAEWQVLITAVNNDGYALKAYSRMDASSSTNASNFSAVLAGTRFNTGEFLNLDFNTYFWSSTENNVSSVYFVSLGYQTSQIDLLNTNKDNGFSIRCLKD